MNTVCILLSPPSSPQRPRNDDDMRDSDDDISLVSRTPSPPPSNAMDIDKYDEYHRGTEREVITVETKIKSTNKGFAMLAKLGWVEGQPLGNSGDGMSFRHIIYSFPQLMSILRQDVSILYHSMSKTISPVWENPARMSA